MEAKARTNKTIRKILPFRANRSSMAKSHRKNDITKRIYKLEKLWTARSISRI